MHVYHINVQPGAKFFILFCTTAFIYEFVLAYLGLWKSNDEIAPRHNISHAIKMLFVSYELHLNKCIYCKQFYACKRTISEAEIEFSVHAVHIFIAAN